MNIFNLLGASFDTPIPKGLTVEKGVCCFTGETCDTLPRGKVLDKTFNKHDFLKAPNSDRIGVNAWRTLQSKEERMSCWVFYGGKLHTVGDVEKGKDLSRAEARKFVLGLKPSTPWAGYWSTSFHKHGAFCSPVNLTKDSNLWGFEDRTIDCSDLEHVNWLFGVLMGLKVRGAMEFELAEARFTAKTTNLLGVETVLKYQALLTPIKRSGVYSLMMYLLYSQSEIKAIGEGVKEIWPLK